MCIREVIAVAQLIQPAHVRVRQWLPARVINPFSRVADLQPANQVNRSNVQTRAQKGPQAILNPSALPSPVPVRGDRRSQPAQDSVTDRRRAEAQPRQNTRASDPVTARTAQPTHQPVDVDDATQAQRLEQIRRDLQRRASQNNRNRPQQVQQQRQGTSWNFRAGNQPVALPSNPLRLATKLLRPGPTLLIDSYVELLRRTGFAIEPAIPPPSFSPGMDGLSVPNLEDYFPPAPGFPPLGPAQALPPGNFRLVELEFYFEDESVPDSDYLEQTTNFTPRDVRLRAESVSGLNLGSLGGNFVGTNKLRVYIGNSSGSPPGWNGTFFGLERFDYNLLGNQVSRSPEEGGYPTPPFGKRVRIVREREYRIINLPEPQPFIPIVCRGEQQMQCEARVLIPLLKEILNELRISVRGRDCGEQQEKFLGRGLKGLSKQVQLSLNASCGGYAPPEFWELRPGIYPQAAVVFGNLLPNGIGRERRTLHIPHYRLARGQKPAIPEYDRGPYWARLILKDNSKIYCYAKSTNEAIRVVNALATYAKQSLLPGTPPTTGKVGYAKSSWRAVPLYLQYYSDAKKGIPDWQIELRQTPP